MNEFTDLDRNTSEDSATCEGQVHANTFHAKYKAFETHAVAVGAEQAAQDMVKHCKLPEVYTPVIKAYFEATNLALDLHQTITCSMAHEQPDEAIKIMNKKLSEGLK